MSDESSGWLTIQWDAFKVTLRRGLADLSSILWAERLGWLPRVTISVGIGFWIWPRSAWFLQHILLVESPWNRIAAAFWAIALAGILFRAGHWYRPTLEDRIIAQQTNSTGSQRLTEIDWSKPGPQLRYAASRMRRISVLSLCVIFASIVTALVFALAVGNFASEDQRRKVIQLNDEQTLLAKNVQDNQLSVRKFEEDLTLLQETFPSEAGHAMAVHGLRAGC